MNNKIASIIKVGKIFINNQTGVRFRIIEVTEDKVICRTASKLQKSGPKIPLDFTLNIHLFADYLFPSDPNKEPTFKLIL
jgi:hypothetical protein